MALITLIECTSRALVVAASRLRCESSRFVMVPASLVPTLSVVLLFYPGFSGIALVFLGSWLLRVPPPYCVLLYFTAPASLAQSFAYLVYPVPFTSFLKTNRLNDFDAQLDSLELISLIECISRAPSAAASRLFWEFPLC